MQELRDAIGRVPPGRPALVDGSRTLAYGELATAIDDECRWLVSAAPARVALLAENGCSWALADLALLAAGIPNLPLPKFFTAAQRAHALDDAGIDTLLTDAPEAVLAQHPDFAPAGTSPVTGLARLVRVPPRVPVLHAGTVKITYTSGSTGTPKGVCLGADALLAVSTSLAQAVGGSEVSRHLCVLPLSTLLENLSGIYVPLLLGATSALPPASRTGLSYGAFDPARFLQYVAVDRPHSLVLVPELLRLLLAGIARGVALPSLRFVAVGGARVPPALLAQAAALGVPAYEGYGLSECASVVCLNTPGANRPGSAGRPLPHARVTTDARGEIHVEGAVMLGYLGERPQGGRRLATGDLGAIDADGYVHVHGRLKNQFITGFGRNVSPEWVESELAAEPQVAQALAFGEGRPHVAALLLPAGPGIDAAQLQAAVDRVNTRLPDYAQVRAWLPFDAAPTQANGLATANGRPRRDAILARYGDRIETLYETTREAAEATHGIP